MNAPWGSNALRLVGPRAHQPPSPSRIEARYSRGLGGNAQPGWERPIEDRRPSISHRTAAYRGSDFDGKPTKRKAWDIIATVIWLAAVAVLFDWVILNWLLGCGQPNGSCIGI